MNNLQTPRNTKLRELLKMRTRSLQKMAVERGKPSSRPAYPPMAKKEGWLREAT